jgi:hypothetical protein
MGLTRDMTVVVAESGGKQSGDADETSRQSVELLPHALAASYRRCIEGAPANHGNTGPDIQPRRLHLVPDRARLG